MRAYNEDDDAGCGLPSRLVPLLAPRLDASEGSVLSLDAFLARSEKNKTRHLLIVAPAPGYFAVHETSRGRLRLVETYRSAPTNQQMQDYSEQQRL